jgi:tetratricopeptide (TPR) repeat protein
MLVGIYVKEKNYKKAMDLCTDYMNQNKDNNSLLARAEYLQGNVYLQQENFKEARAQFEKAVEIEPNLLAPYAMLAKLSLRDKNYEEAISSYETILTKNPDYLVGYMAIGSIYDQLGNDEKAEEYYRKALKIKEDFGAAANNLAWKLAERGGNIDEALNYATIAKEQMPENPSVMDTLGWIYYLKGSYLNAISELQDSVELVPDNPVINYHLGMAFYKNNKPDGASEYLKKALELDPEFKGADEAKKVLEEIKNK